MFVHRLAIVFKKRFNPGSIHQKITGRVITLLRENNQDGDWVENFRLIILLSTDLKILARVLTSRLQIVADKLIGPEQTCAVKGRTIQDNLHLLCTILNEVDDGTGTPLVNLDQRLLIEWIIVT